MAKAAEHATLASAPTAGECALYFAQTVDEIPQPSIRNLSPPQLSYISNLIRNGVNHYIDNIPQEVDFGLIVHNGCALPFTVSHRETLAFPISPKTCYLSYPLLIEEKAYGLKKAPVARAALKFLERSVRFDKLIVLNNWFITNNPTPVFSEEDMNAFVRELTRRYPKHMLVIKSIPKTDPTNVISALQGCGFDLIDWRICHYWRPSGPRRSKRTKQFRVDRRLLETTDLNTFYATEMSDGEASACERLYQSLYIGKHTPMNVELNRRWFSLTCNCGFLDYFMITDDASLKAFAISYNDPIGVNTGFLGYDLKDGRDLGLYRMVVISTLLRAIREDQLVNLSTGVARFKELRGAQPSIEHDGVYTKHLSFAAHILLRLFVWAYNRFGDSIRSR